MSSYKDKKIEEFVKTDEIIELPSEPRVKKRKAIVANITSEWVTLDIGGLGERIPYNQKDHANLKRGDELYVT